MSTSSDNFAVAKRLRAAAVVLRKLPQKMGEFYANGGVGVQNPVVGDRFQGQGNARFAPLSTPYALAKAGASKDLNKAQFDKYGRGSKLLKVEHRRRWQGLDVRGFTGASLPILVRTGKLRAMVAFQRAHRIDANGDVAIVTFVNLPNYAKWLHKGTANMPARSPVNPNEADIARVRDFAERQLSAQLNRGSASTAFGGGLARII